MEFLQILINVVPLIKVAYGKISQNDKCGQNFSIDTLIIYPKITQPFSIESINGPNKHSLGKIDLKIDKRMHQQGPC